VDLQTPRNWLRYLKRKQGPTRCHALRPSLNTLMRRATRGSRATDLPPVAPQPRGDGGDDGVKEASGEGACTFLEGAGGKAHDLGQHREEVSGTGPLRLPALKDREDVLGHASDLLLSVALQIKQRTLKQ
jgi:hypothetical protein